VGVPMLGTRSPWCYPVLLLWLGGACTVTMQPISSGPDAKPATDLGPFNEAGDRFTGNPDRFTGNPDRFTGNPGGDADPSGSLSSGLLAYYPCEQAVDSVLPDASGNNRHATIISTATGDAGFRFAGGRMGKALYFVSPYNAYVMLPPGMLADASEVTIAAWVNLNSQRQWQRLWTFSTNEDAYMYLTTSLAATGLARGGITLVDNPGDAAESVQGSTALPVKVWKHLAFVLGPAGMSLFIDGTQVAANPASTVRPTDMGKTFYDYIGRSNFDWDAYLDGNIDEFRVYNRALSPAEIRALASGS
jgi:hypothetical protein